MLDALLVEDDRDLAMSIIDHLEIENIICDYAANGIEGAALIDNNRYDVLVFDINMPGMDGLTLCEKVRGGGNDTPILMLTARDTLESKIEGFRVGTDDYLVKPFEIEELIVRLRALAKRRSGQASLFEVGPLRLDLNSRAASLRGIPVKLSPTGYKLLEQLMRASPDPVSQSELTLKVWGDDIPGSNKLRVHIHNLRKALDAAGAGHLLKTSPGFGFFISDSISVSRP